MVSTSNDRTDLSSAGIYLLLGKSEDGMTDRVYIGEAENAYNRLYQHLAINKYEWKEWTECLVFVSKDDNLNKAKIKYLENRLYKITVGCNRYSVVNNVVPAFASLSEGDVSEMEGFIDNLCLLTGAMGIKVFEPIIPNKEENGKELFYIKRKNKDSPNATGIIVADGFVVLKGSMMETGYEKYAYATLRASLIESGSVDEDGRFTRDVLFSSYSAASSVVIGYNTNGWLEWKTEDGRTLDAYMKDMSKVTD
jgi:hypothetical protein